MAFETPFASIRILVVASAAWMACARGRHATFVGSFSVATPYPGRRASRRAAPLAMAGMGMGGASTKQKKGKKKKGGSGNNSRGMGKKKSSGSGSEKYDVAKAMIKSEKLYDELLAESTRALNSDEWDEDEMDITSEYIITARGTPGAAMKKEAAGALACASDWIPVAQVCVVRPVSYEEQTDDDCGGMHPSVRAAVSYYRREINYASTLAAPALKSLPRNIIEYGVEPVDSFVKYVYEDVIEGKAVESFDDGSGSGEKVGMTKSKAREILGIEAGCKDAAVIKGAYKKQSMALHPDRFVTSDKTKEEIDQSSQQFALVKMAYEALNSGVRNGDGNGNGSGAPSSWYESLGGKSRTEFVGPIRLLSAEEANALCNKAFRSAVVGLDPELTMSFVARNQAAAR